MIQSLLREKRDAEALPVVAAMAELQELSETFSLYSTLQPKHEAVLRPPSQVIVKQIFARIGDRVKRGQPLVSFQSDSQALRSELDQLDLARKEMDIELTLALSKKHFVSGRELKQTQLDKRATELRRKLQETESQQILRSPIDGVLAEMSLFQGDFIDQAQNHTVRVIHPSGFRVQAYVPNSISSKLKIGGEAHLSLVQRDDNATPPTGGPASEMAVEREWIDGSIDAIGSTIDPKTGSIFLSVIAGDTPEGWKAGALVELKLVIEKHEMAIVVPTRSLVWKKNKPYLFKIVEEPSARAPASSIKEEEERVKVARVDVELGIHNETVTEITKGITEGDQVVVRGQSSLETADANTWARLVD